MGQKSRSDATDFLSFRLEGSLYFEVFGACRMLRDAHPKVPRCTSQTNELAQRGELCQTDCVGGVRSERSFLHRAIPTPSRNHSRDRAVAMRKAVHTPGAKLSSFCTGGDGKGGP